MAEQQDAEEIEDGDLGGRGESGEVLSEPKSKAIAAASKAHLVKIDAETAQLNGLEAMELNKALRDVIAGSRKQGVRYRYYISHPLLQARKQDAGTVSRVPADEIERAVIGALRKQELLANEDMIITAQEISSLVERIEIKQYALEITLVSDRSPDSGRRKSKAKPVVLSVPWTKRPSNADKGVIHMPPTEENRLPSETREVLLKAIAFARKRIADIESGAATSLVKIAKREGKVERHIRLLLPLAFVPPALISSIIDGTARKDLTVTGLAKQVPLHW